MTRNEIKKYVTAQMKVGRCALGLKQGAYICRVTTRAGDKLPYEQAKETVEVGDWICVDMHERTPTGETETGDVLGYVMMVIGDPSETVVSASVGG